MRSRVPSQHPADTHSLCFRYFSRRGGWTERCSSPSAPARRQHPFRGGGGFPRRVLRTRGRVRWRRGEGIPKFTGSLKGAEGSALAERGYPPARLLEGGSSDPSSGGGDPRGTTGPATATGEERWPSHPTGTDPASFRHRGMPGGWAGRECFIQRRPTSPSLTSRLRAQPGASECRGSGQRLSSKASPAGAALLGDPGRAGQSLAVPHGDCGRRHVMPGRTYKGLGSVGRRRRVGAFPPSPSSGGVGRGEPPSQLLPSPLPLPPPLLPLPSPQPSQGATANPAFFHLPSLPPSFIIHITIIYYHCFQAPRPASGRPVPPPPPRAPSTAPPSAATTPQPRRGPASSGAAERGAERSGGAGTRSPSGDRSPSARPRAHPGSRR